MLTCYGVIAEHVLPLWPQSGCWIGMQNRGERECQVAPHRKKFFSRGYFIVPSISMVVSYIGLCYSLYTLEHAIRILSVFLCSIVAQIARAIACIQAGRASASIQFRNAVFTILMSAVIEANAVVWLLNTAAGFVLSLSMGFALVVASFYWLKQLSVVAVLLYASPTFSVLAAGRSNMTHRFDGEGPSSAFVSILFASINACALFIINLWFFRAKNRRYNITPDDPECQTVVGLQVSILEQSGRDSQTYTGDRFPQTQCDEQLGGRTRGSERGNHCPQNSSTTIGRGAQTHTDDGSTQHPSAGTDGMPRCIAFAQLATASQDLPVADERQISTGNSCCAEVSPTSQEPFETVHERKDSRASKEHSTYEIALDPEPAAVAAGETSQEPQELTQPDNEGEANATCLRRARPASAAVAAGETSQEPHELSQPDYDSASNNESEATATCLRRASPESAEPTVRHIALEAQQQDEWAYGEDELGTNSRGDARGDVQERRQADQNLDFDEFVARQELELNENNLLAEDAPAVDDPADPHEYADRVLDDVGLWFTESSSEEFNSNCD